MKNSLIKSAALAAIAVVSALSCTKEQNVESPVSQNELHFIIETAENTPVKSFIENNLDETYTPKWSNGDELALFVGEITSSTSEPTAILSNINEEGVTAKFDGTVPTELTKGSFLSFCPAGAFEKGYTDGTIGINLSETQKPSSLTIDEACDILVAKPYDFTAEEGKVVINDLFFKRIFSILKVNLSGVETLNGEQIKSFTLTAPVTLTGRAAVDLSTATISKWNVDTKSVTATYSEDCPVFGGADGLENTVWLVVNPTTIPSGSTVTFSGETENYTFSKDVTLTKDIVFPDGQLAVINLTIGEGNFAAKTSETRIWVEGFDNVETTATQLQPTATGVLGTGVTESLSYEYSSKNTNLRFNSNGHSSTNPYLYLSAANDNLIISNIKISGETALKFSCQSKTLSGSATITINYKESSSAIWSEAGTVSAETGTFDIVNSIIFAISPEATSLDVQIVTSAEKTLVDDLVLESFVDTRTTLSAPTNVSVSVDAETPNTLNVSWDAVENASGYTVVLSADGKEDIVKTATKSSLAVTGLDYSTTYSVKVKATTSDVENFIESEYSTVVTGTTGEKGSTIEDKLVSSLFPATSTTYVEFTGVSVLSNAVYAGETSFNNNGISLRATKPSGIVTTTSGGKVKKVVVEWISSTSSGRTIDVYGKNTAYSTAADLYNTSTQGTKIGTIVYGTSTELTISDDYQYIGVRSNNATLYVSSITITWDASGASEGGSDPEQLAAPVVSCSTQTANSLTFTWAAVANATGYQVSTDGGVNYGDTQTETKYTWTGLDVNTTKTLYVKAIGDGSSYTDSDVASATGTTTAGSGSGEGSGETTSYEIVFTTGSNTNSTISQTTNVSDVVSSGSDYIDSFTSNCSKAYHKSTSGVKLGSKSDPGTLEFTLANAVKSNVVSIKVETAQYSSDSGTITMYNGTTELKSGIAPADGYTHQFASPTTVESLKFVTSAKRAYISKITIKVNK